MEYYKKLKIAIKYEWMVRFSSPKKMLITFRNLFADVIMCVIVPVISVVDSVCSIVRILISPLTFLYEVSKLNEKSIELLQIKIGEQENE